MPKDSGVGENNRSRFGGGARALGDAFQPNLAMGGGTYRVPIELPQGPGGLTPKIDLTYDTSAGNGPFGLGWSISLPYVVRMRPRAFRAESEPEYALAGAMTLVPTTEGDFVASVAERLQRFRLDGNTWHSRTLELAELRFGASAEARVEASVDGVTRTQRWCLDRMRFPGDRDITYEYQRDGGQLYPKTIRWSLFRLELVWEERPDPWSSYDPGFEVRTTRRCARIELHHDRLSPNSLIRTIDFTYETAAYTETSLLRRLVTTGWRHDGDDWQTAALPPLEFSYTRFSPEARRIERLRSTVSPPPRLARDVTLVDLGGTSLPGVFRLDRHGGTYWENRGDGRFGPPAALRQLPAGVALSDPGVRFADMEGRGKADLVVGRRHEGGYYPNGADEGFGPKRTIALQPSFDIGEDGSHLVDVDGDRVSDLLTFRGTKPMAFLNRGGRQWQGPEVLGESGLPPNLGADPAMRFVDMTGDGLPDVVLMRSRRITYYPNLGRGRWGPERVMADTPEFDTDGPAERVFLGDVDGDGVADLVVFDGGELRIYLNRAGEGFSEPLTLTRAPQLAADRVLLADMKGSGTSGLLFMSPRSTSGAVRYWFLDLLDGVKPNLLARIDNHAGLLTDVNYSTSARERTRDLDAGRRWTGYLPFVVPVVKELTVADVVTGQRSTTVFEYHDGHFDGVAREYLGFAEVDSTRTTGPQEAPDVRRMYYHTRHATARDPAFIAGRGQPHRTEVLDPETGEVIQLEETEWDAVRVAGTAEDRPAHLALQRGKTSSRLEGGVVYQSERTSAEFDTVGNQTGERRRSQWTDSTGAPRVELLDIETSYASHATHGPTTFKSRVRKRSGDVLLKEMRHHYDGPAFTGLPLGEVELGFQTRQVEVALTSREIEDVFGGVVPDEVAGFDTETDPDFGTLYLRPTGRARVDGFGNEVEVIDAGGFRRRFQLDADALHPVSVQEDGGAARVLEHDPAVQLVARVEDLNGHLTVTEYDPLGFVAAVYRPGALPGRPTEEYEYVRDRVPNAVAQRIRVDHGDAVPGAVKVDYYDGTARRCQTKTLSEDGRWAAGRHEIFSVAGRRLGVRDGYFSFAPDYDAAPPPATAETETHYDSLGRVVRERLFNGRWTSHEYQRNRVLFFGPDAHDARETDPTVPPTRESVLNTQGLVTAILERDAGRPLEVRREYDVLRRLRRVTDPEGNVALDNAYDLWGNRIRIRSTEGGETVHVFDAGNREARRTDADGRVLISVRDTRGRVTELREGAGGQLLERYHYDTGAGDNVGGQLARVEGDFGTVEYGYSPDGQATSITRAIAGVATPFVTRFAYNNRRDVTQVVYPDGSTIDYAYHPTGTLASIPGFIDAVEYGPTGLRERIVYANGLETRRRYTPGDYLITELLTQQQGGGHRYQHLVYTLDGVGQALQVDDLSTVPGKLRLNQSYTYDDRNRLIAATGSAAGFDFEYAYDDLGNMTSNGETGQELVYGREVGNTAAPNRLVRRRSSAVDEYRYDASGNLTVDPELGTLTYDSRHRLVRVDRPDGTVVEYAYDHNDRRIRTRVQSGTSVETRLEIEGLYLVENGGAAKVVFDENRRMAVIPAAGDAMLHHYDRLGNVNVLSNADTGAFAGHDEYTPYGQMFVSIVIEPAFTFQGGRFSDGLGIVLLGARFYRPSHGRFLTCDPYLYYRQEKIPPLLSALNLYIYSYANPTNFTDPTGEIAPIVVAIIIAAIVGAIIGVGAAAANGAQTWEEWFLYVVGGIIGGILTVLFWYGILVWIGVAAAAAAAAAVVITALASFASLFTPLLDDSDSGVAWGFSWAIKLIKSPVLTILGLFAVAGFAAAGNRVDFRRGTLFVEVGAGMDALTLGAIVYTQSSYFQADGTVRDDFARHEAYHTRGVAALGEAGYYFTYAVIGSIFAAASGGPWNALDAAGCGNPFESHAYTFYNPIVMGPSTTEVGVTSC